MANTDVYVNKVTVPKGDGNTYTGILVDTASQKTWYGTSSTGATTQAKVVTCSGFYLQTGAIISVAFSTANTYTSAKITLNVNNTGAKDVYYNNAVTSSTNTLKWDVGEQVTFIYNGTGYYFVTKSKGGAVTDVQVGGTSILSSGVANIVTNSTYNSSTNKIATMSDVPSVTSTYSSTGTTAVTGTAVNAALQTLDSSITATTNQAISAITITDGKIASSSKINVTPQLNWYGTCNTNYTVYEKIVSCSDYTANNCNIIMIAFNNNNYGGDITLNVNSTGAKQVIYGNDIASSTNPLSWDAGDRLTFMYLGSYYVFLSRDSDARPLTIRTWS